MVKIEITENKEYNVVCSNGKTYNCKTKEGARDLAKFIETKIVKVQMQEVNDKWQVQGINAEGEVVRVQDCDNAGTAEMWVAFANEVLGWLNE